MENKWQEVFKFSAACLSRKKRVRTHSKDFCFVKRDGGLACCSRASRYLCSDFSKYLFYSILFYSITSELGAVRRS